MRYLLTLLFAALSLNAIGQIEYDFPYNPDADNDAFVSSTDLLELLAIYGQAFSTDELYLSQDSSSLIVKIGHEMTTRECLGGCMHLEGNWRVVKQSDVSYFHDFLSADLALYEGNTQSVSFTETNEFMIIDDNYQYQHRQTEETFRFFLKNELYYEGNLWAPHFSLELAYNYLPQYHKAECWCVTHQRPRIEYKVLQTENIEISQREEVINEAAQEGWRLMPSTMGSSGNATMWRWAE